MLSATKDFFLACGEGRVSKRWMSLERVKEGGKELNWETIAERAEVQKASQEVKSASLCHSELRDWCQRILMYGWHSDRSS